MLGVRKIILPLVFVLFKKKSLLITDKIHCTVLCLLRFFLFVLLFLLTTKESCVTKMCIMRVKKESVAQSRVLALKAKVKHDGAWPPNGGCPLCARLCARPEISSESTSFCAGSTKVLRMRR